MIRRAEGRSNRRSVGGRKGQRVGKGEGVIERRGDGEGSGLRKEKGLRRNKRLIENCFGFQH